MKQKLCIYEGGGYVIHFASPEGSEISQENAVVHRATFTKFKDGCPVKVIEIEGSKSADETLRIARSLIGTKIYNFLTFNCDHFATWCKTGEYRSIQVNEAKAILRESMGGSIGSIVEIVCTIHDITEMLTAPRLDTVYPKQENEIEDIIKTKTYMDETIQTSPDEEKDRPVDYEIIEEEPIAENKALEDNAYVDDDGTPPLPPAKKAWYEKAGDVLKTLTYPIAGALEVVKRVTNIPIIRNIDFLHLGSKVRNTIDNIVTSIKVFTGRMTKEEAIEERMNNETPLAGSVIQQKHE